MVLVMFDRIRWGRSWVDPMGNSGQEPGASSLSIGLRSRGL